MLLPDQSWHDFWLKSAQLLVTQEPENGCEYCLFSLGADECEKVWRSSHSVFVGLTPTTPHYELREPSIINPRAAIAQFRALGEPPLILNRSEELVPFLFLGGHAIIKRTILKQSLPQWMEPHEVAPLGAKLGFVTASSVPQSKFVKRPQKKMKQRVRERDGNKCLLCQKGTADGVMLTLHHITMRKYGGFTEDNNLATVCRGCHDGIGEFIRYDFYQLIGIDRYDVSSANRKYIEDVKRYREVMRKHTGREPGPSQVDRCEGSAGVS